ncbi:MAG: hypothetical protein ACREHC_01270 [Candidatus Levyibacteriota bacterium]
MSKQNTNRTVLFNNLLQQWIGFFEVQIIALIKLSYEKGATKKEIAEQLEIDSGVFTRKYSKYLEVKKV